jgi:hypothetical protein
MHSLLAVWLITLLSLTNHSAVGQPSHLMQRGTPITVEEYWEFVRNTRQSIVQMEQEPEAAIRQQLNALASQWEQITVVELSDNSVMQIDSTYLASQLRSDPPKLEQLRNLLDTLIYAHEEYPQKIFTIQDVEPLKEILARPEFQWQQGQAIEIPNWLANLYDRFFNFLERMLFRTGTLVYQGRTLLMIAAALLFIFSLVYISRNLSRSLVREAQLAAESSESDELLTSKGAFKRAETLSMQGDYRNAIRYLYLSSLLVLDEQRLLRYDRSRTNREYLQSISSKPALANPLRKVIEVFDRVWYGFESVDEQTYRSYVEHVEDLREKKE